MAKVAITITSSMNMFSILIGANAAKFNKENLLESHSDQQKPLINPPIGRIVIVNNLIFSKVTYALHVTTYRNSFKRLERKVVNFIWSRTEWIL